MWKEFASIERSNVPKLLKLAHIRPMLKKTGLYENLLKNYRPVSVSNLLFVSKVLEKIISNRLTAHLAQNDLMDVIYTVCLSLFTL